MGDRFRTLSLNIMHNLGMADQDIYDLYGKMTFWVDDTKEIKIILTLWIW